MRLFPIFLINIAMYCTRVGQDQGGSRWDIFTKKSKSTKLHHIVLNHPQGVVAYDPVLYGGCISPTLTPLKVKPEALILFSIGGRTLQYRVMYIFLLCFCVTKIDFYHQPWNWQVKRLIKQHKTIGNVSFYIWKKVWICHKQYTVYAGPDQGGPFYPHCVTSLSQM